MPSDSVKSSHILFAYKGAERSTSNRTKEEAKL
jgi:peptidyl-prolyl cis-trans isomerase D